LFSFFIVIIVINFNITLVISAMVSVANVPFYLLPQSIRSRTALKKESVCWFPLQRIVLPWLVRGTPLSNTLCVSVWVWAWAWARGQKCK